MKSCGLRPQRLASWSSFEGLGHGSDCALDERLVALECFGLRFQDGRALQRALPNHEFREVPTIDQGGELLSRLSMRCLYTSSWLLSKHCAVVAFTRQRWYDGIPIHCCSTASRRAAKKPFCNSASTALALESSAIFAARSGLSTGGTPRVRNLFWKSCYF
jgi:hypothetical protein